MELHTQRQRPAHTLRVPTHTNKWRGVWYRTNPAINTLTDLHERRVPFSSSPLGQEAFHVALHWGARHAALSLVVRHSARCLSFCEALHPKSPFRVGIGGASSEMRARLAIVLALLVAVAVVGVLAKDTPLQARGNLLEETLGVVSGDAGTRLPHAIVIALCAHGARVRLDLGLHERYDAVTRFSHDLHVDVLLVGFERVHFDEVRKSVICFCPLP